MGYEAKIIADSTYQGSRITTLQLRYPRFIHSELMTHRVFSRNASSSRAIPVEKMIQAVLDAPARPLRFMKNKPGMQATEYCTPEEEAVALAAWLAARDDAVAHARKLVALNIHKQFANRLLEPWMWISVVVTSTEWENFFELRLHKDAQPEFQNLALLTFNAMCDNASEPLQEGQWHLPYVGDVWETPSVAIKCSVARCARVSYLTHEGKEPSVEDDLKLYDRLVGSKPWHASPLEHQAQATAHHRKSGNLRGPWMQYRKIFEASQGFARV